MAKASFPFQFADTVILMCKGLVWKVNLFFCLSLTFPRAEITMHLNLQQDVSKQKMA